MTVRSYVLWVGVAIAISACSFDHLGDSSPRVDVLTLPGEPAMLSRKGRGVSAELPPLPMSRGATKLAAGKGVPPLPATRPARVAPAIPSKSLENSGSEVAHNDISEQPDLNDHGIEPIEQPLFEPNKFFGMSATGVRTLLGPPQMIFERPPSTVWHYRDGRCELDLYFYLDVASGEFRVATFDLSPHQENAELRHERRCLKRLRIAYHAS